MSDDRGQRFPEVPGGYPLHQVQVWRREMGLDYANRIPGVPV